MHTSTVDALVDGFSDAEDVPENALHEAALETRGMVMLKRMDRDAAIAARSKCAYQSPEWDAATVIGNRAADTLQRAEWTNSAAWARYRTDEDLTVLAGRLHPHGYGFTPRLLSDSDIEAVEFLAALSPIEKPQATRTWLRQQAGPTETILAFVCHLATETASDFPAPSIDQLPATEQVVALGQVANVVGYFHLKPRADRHHAMYRRGLAQEERDLDRERRRRSRYDQPAVNDALDRVNQYREHLLFAERVVDALDHAHAEGAELFT